MRHFESGTRHPTERKRGERARRETLRRRKVRAAKYGEARR